MSKHDEGSSKWGKGKTDPDTWWKKGAHSPNPSGRPKGSKNQKTMYKEAFGKKVQVNLDGETKKLSLAELGYCQLAQKAGAGDLKAIAMQVQLDEKFDPPATPPPTLEESHADFDTLETWVALREKFSAFKKNTSGSG